MRIVKNYLPDEIILMDETAVLFDLPGDNTVYFVGVKSVPVRTRGHEKYGITVCLAAIATGKKLQPMVAFNIEHTAKLELIPMSIQCMQYREMTS